MSVYDRFLGSMSRERAKSDAVVSREVGVGERIHKFSTIQNKHEIRNKQILNTAETQTLEIKYFMKWKKCFTVHEHEQMFSYYCKF